MLPGVPRAARPQLTPLWLSRGLPFTVDISTISRLPGRVAPAALGAAVVFNAGCCRRLEGLNHCEARLLAADQEGLNAETHHLDDGVYRSRFPGRCRFGQSHRPQGIYTRAQVDIAWTRAGGGSTAGKGHGGFGCKTSKGEVECNAAGECIGKCQHCGTGEIGSVRGILRPSHDRKTPSPRRAEEGRQLSDGQCRRGAAPAVRRLHVRWAHA
jgi:hypothetical protein